MIVPRGPASYVRVVVVQTEVDSGASNVKVYCLLLDQHFSPRVDPDSSDCHVSLATTTGNARVSQRRSCRGNRNSGKCNINFDVSHMLEDGDLAVTYGLNASCIFTHPRAIMVHPVAVTVEQEALSAGVAPIESTIVMSLPARSLYPSETFTITVSARGTETMSYAKFAVDVSGSSLAIEIVSGSATALGGSTWTMSPGNVADGIQMFILTKKASDSCAVSPSPCYEPQPGSHANQPILTLQLRVSANPLVLPAGNAAIRLRVYEFSIGSNPEVPPGGNPIVPTSQGGTGWVDGSAIGRRDTSQRRQIATGTYRNSPGQVTIAANQPSGMFSVLSSGLGTVFNLAPLTGSTETHQLSSWAYYPSGSTERGISQSSMICDPLDSSGILSVSAICTLAFTTSHLNGSANIDLIVGHGTLTTTLNLAVYAPAVPLAIATAVPTLGPMELSAGVPLLDAADCSQRWASTEIKAATTFSSGATTTRELDVTALVRSQFTSTNPAVATVDTTGLVTGVTSGAASITLGSVLGSAWVLVDGSAPWTLKSLLVRHFASIQLSFVSDQVTQVELVMTNMDRTRSSGRHPLVSWAEFGTASSPDTVIVEDLSYASNASYELHHPHVTTVVESSNSETLDYVEALANGNATIELKWTPSCTTAVYTSTTAVEVQLPAPSGVWISNGVGEGRSNSVTMAHVNDAATLSGAVGTTAQRIGFVIDYGSYRDVWNAVTDPVKYEIADGSIVELLDCTNGAGKCLYPIAGQAGITVIDAYMGASRPADVAQIATLTVTIVKVASVAILARPYAYPSYVSTNRDIATLKALGDPSVTNTFEQAELTVLAHLSNGDTQDVSSSHRVVFNSSDQSQITIAGRIANVELATRTSGLTTISASFPGLNGDALQRFVATKMMAVDRTVNQVVAISNVQLFRGLSDRRSLGYPPTLHGVKGSMFSTVFSATFADGFVVSDNNMGRGQFGVSFMSRGLFSFSSSHPDLPVDSQGIVTVSNNTMGTVSITVSVQGVSSSSPGYYANLKARAYEIDIATSPTAIGQGAAISISNGQTELVLQLYFTSGSVPLGALEMELTFDDSKLRFVSAVGGSDFNQNFGADASRTAGIVEFGGVTTDYLSGSNLHVATIGFVILPGTAGIVQFEGRVMSTADQHGNNQNPEVPPTPFPFGDVGLVQADLAGRRDRRDVTALSRFDQERTKRRVHKATGGCVAGSGPYPTGDVNGDCTFDTTDALVTAQFLLINSDGASAVDAFFANKHGHGIIQGSRTEEAMDVDFNAQVMVADVQHMIFVKYNSRRFVKPVTQTCTSTGDRIAVSVERANAHEYVGDPANRDNTKVFLVITGGVFGVSQLGPQIQAQFAGLGDSFTMYGSRFLGVMEALAADTGTTGSYAATFQSFGSIYGVSVIHVINTTSGWTYGYFSTGDPQNTPNKIENTGFDMQVRLAIAAIGATTVNVGVAFAFSPFALITEPCSIATVSPSASPSAAPANSLPTQAPTWAPTTPVPSRLPTTSPASSRPTDSPSASPAVVEVLEISMVPGVVYTSATLITVTVTWSTATLPAVIRPRLGLVSLDMTEEEMRTAGTSVIYQAPIALPTTSGTMPITMYIKSTEQLMPGIYRLYLYTAPEDGGWADRMKSKGVFINTQRPPATTVSSSVCEDSANGAADADGYSCTYYQNNPGECGTVYDTRDFTSATMCCSCGGGAPGGSGHTSATLTTTEPTSHPPSLPPSAETSSSTCVETDPVCLTISTSICMYVPEIQRTCPVTCGACPAVLTATPTSAPSRSTVLPTAPPPTLPSCPPFAEAMFTRHGLERVNKPAKGILESFSTTSVEACAAACVAYSGQGRCQAFETKPRNTDVLCTLRQLITSTMSPNEVWSTHIRVIFECSDAAMLPMTTRVPLTSSTPMTNPTTQGRVTCEGWCDTLKTHMTTTQGRNGRCLCDEDCVLRQDCCDDFASFCSAALVTTALPTVLTTESSMAGTAEPCQNQPGWQDSQGDSCIRYFINRWCTSNGGMGTGWPSTETPFSAFATDGIDATDACCACGGSATAEDPTLPPAVTTTDAIPDDLACVSEPMDSCNNANSCCSGLVCLPQFLQGTIAPLCVVLDPASGSCFAEEARCSASLQCCSGVCSTDTHRCSAPASVSTTLASTARATTAPPELASTTSDPNAVCQDEPMTRCMNTLPCCSGLVCLPTFYEGSLAPLCTVFAPPTGTCFDTRHRCTANDQCCSRDCNTDTHRCASTPLNPTTASPVASSPTIRSASTTEAPLSLDPDGVCWDQPMVPCGSAGPCCTGLVCLPAFYLGNLVPVCKVLDPATGSCYSPEERCSAHSHCCSGWCAPGAYRCADTAPDIVSPVTLAPATSAPAMTSAPAPAAPVAPPTTSVPSVVAEPTLNRLTIRAHPDVLVAGAGGVTGLTVDFGTVEPYPITIVVKLKGTGVRGSAKVTPEVNAGTVTIDVSYAREPVAGTSVKVLVYMAPAASSTWKNKIKSTNVVIAVVEQTTTANPNAPLGPEASCAGSCFAFVERTYNGEPCYCDIMCLMFGPCCPDFGLECQDGGPPTTDVPTTTATSLDCDVRWDSGSPAFSKCVSEPYFSGCQWRQTQEYPYGQCLDLDYVVPTTPEATTAIVTAAADGAAGCQATPFQSCMGATCCGTMACLPWGNPLVPSCIVTGPRAGECYAAGETCTADSHCCTESCNLESYQCVAPATTVAVCIAAVNTPCTVGADECCDGMACRYAKGAPTAMCAVVDPPSGECYYSGEQCSINSQCCSSDCDTSRNVCVAAQSTTVTPAPETTTATNVHGEVCVGTPFASCAQGRVCCATRRLICIPAGNSFLPTCILLNPSFGECYADAEICSSNSMCCSGSCDVESFRCNPGEESVAHQLHGTAALLSCTDRPNWADSAGDTCDNYTRSSFCNFKGGEGPGWAHTGLRISSFADANGVAATAACCACGGGQMNAGTAPVSSPVAEHAVESAARGAESRDDASSDAVAATDGTATLIGFGVAVLLVLLATALFARVNIRKRGAGPDFTEAFSSATQKARSSRNAVSELISRLDADGEFSQEKEPAPSSLRPSSRLDSQQTSDGSMASATYDPSGLARALGQPELEFDDSAFNMGPVGSPARFPLTPRRTKRRAVTFAPQNQERDGSNNKDVKNANPEVNAEDQAGQVSDYDNAEAGTEADAGTPFYKQIE